MIAFAECRHCRRRIPARGLCNRCAARLLAIIREREERRPVLYGLLTANDVRELEKRKARLAG